MKVPLEISFRKVEHSGEIEDLIKEKAAKLEKVCDYISSCRVAVEKTQEHQKSGSPYRVRIDITIPPGHEIVIRREETEGDIHESLEMEIREAFKAAGIKLRKLVDIQHGKKKKHFYKEVNAFVSEIEREEGYGFLKTLDGVDIYFHRNSLAHYDFDKLKIGTGVHFTEETGDKGPQAAIVHVIESPRNI